MGWLWPHRENTRGVVALAPLTLGRYLAALRALGVGDGEAPDVDAAPAGVLLAFLDAVTEGEPLAFSDETALRALARTAWGAVAEQVAKAGATARREAGMAERHFGHFLPDTPDADSGPAPPPLAVALARAEGADYVALTALPLEEALCYLNCRAVVMDYDRSEREDEREGIEWNEDLARN
jgi:hypothetical protein